MLIEKALRRRLRFRIPRSLISILILVLALGISVTPAYAADFIVTNTNDSGEGSLRQAMLDADARPASEHSTITVITTGTITLTSGVLSVGFGTIWMTVEGNGITVSGGGVTRVFESWADSSTVTLNNMTITNGNSVSGAGISNSGTLTLNNVTITGNSSTNFGGAGIYNAGPLTLNNSTVSGNSTTTNGGGIYHDMYGLVLNNSTVSGNSAVNGGGVFIDSGTTATFRNSSIANSTSGGDCANIGSAVTVNFTLIEDGSCGVGTGPAYANGNLSGDPSLGALTIGANGMLYHPLLFGSIAIDVGSNALIPGGITTDQLGNPRIQGGTVDMGSFESSYASITVQLALQARPAAPNNAWVTGVHVEVRPSAGGSPVLAGDYTSNDQGQITLNGLPAGGYNVWIKGTHTLARVHAVTLAVGANNLTTDLLLEGDADDSNDIDILDFSTLSFAYGTSVGDDIYDPRADFNKDASITLIDFSLLASNFAQEGAP